MPPIVSPSLGPDWDGGGIAVVVDVAEIVGGDTRVHEPGDKVLDVDVGVLERAAVVAERFNLGSDQHDPGFAGL